MGGVLGVLECQYLVASHHVSDVASVTCQVMVCTYSRMVFGFEPVALVLLHSRCNPICFFSSGGPILGTGRIIGKRGGKQIDLLNFYRTHTRTHALKTSKRTNDVPRPPLVGDTAANCTASRAPLTPDDASKKGMILETRRNRNEPQHLQFLKTSSPGSTLLSPLHKSCLLSSKSTSDIFRQTLALFTASGNSSFPRGVLGSASSSPSCDRGS